MNYKVLIADDDAAMTRVLGAELTRAGYRVEVCGDGLAAVARVLAWRPHLVLLDHSMPGLDGRAVCARLRRSGLPVRIVMLTGANRLEERVAGLDSGADDYVCKPFEVAELAARLRAQLRGVSVVQEPGSGEGLSIRVLGPFQLHWRGVEVSEMLWNRRQPVQVLKRLLCSYDQPVLADVLEEALWPELDGERARRSLHVAVQRLRMGLRSLGLERVFTSSGGYVFRLAPEDRLDLALLDSQVLEVYRGELLAEERYADWVAGPRQQVHSRAVDLLRREGSREALQRLVELEPCEEAHAVALAAHLLACGEPDSAVAALERHRAVLLAELDVAPGAAWQALRQRLP